MRRTALALAALLAFGLARTSLGQATATAKITGGGQLRQASQAAKPAASLVERRAEVQAAFTSGEQQPAVQQAMYLVPQQMPDGQQVMVLVAQQPMGGDVQLVGHHHYGAAGCPGGNCPGGNCPGGQNGPPWAGGNGLPWNGGYQYNYPTDAVHPGQPHSGGHYGYWGGAHRTPGYPHHHLHREYVGPQGPPTAQVAYPYYTVRGPRDFFMDNPPSIGR